jgi:hypothetical protein
MPIIIDEVVISVEVSNQAAGGATTPPTATQATQEVVAQCVEKVLDILREQKER